MVVSHDAHHERRARTRRLARLVAVLLLTAPLLLGAARAPAASRTSAPVTLLIALEPDHPVYAGDTLTVSASLIGPDPSPVTYQFLWDGAIIQPWDEAASCRLELPDAVGDHRLTVQVRAPAGTIQEAVQTVYVYRKPVDPSDYDPSAD